MNMENLDKLVEKIDEWLLWDKNDKTRSEISNLFQTKDYETLSKILVNRISFGTAGLRAKMGAGYSCINDLTVIQTTQGLLKYLQENNSKLLEENGIIVNYDARHNSKRFAELTAAIFVNAGYTVHLFSSVCPTPFVPFAVTKYQCAAGVMITASHNPKEDNGYKVYSWNGASFISPTDKYIQSYILRNLEPWETSWNTSILADSPLVNDPLFHITELYMSMIDAELLGEHKMINQKSSLNFVYSAMHGVGYNVIQEAFIVAGLDVIPVEEQKEPDPEFPTVRFPNPEEGKSCLDLAIKTAEANKASIILANDPDADRLAVAEKNKQTGEWKIFTGNEIGAVLGWWALHCYEQKNPDANLQNVYMLSSTVSSKILRSMALAENFNFVETLTGFKWMGNKAYELIQEGKEVLFAFEEAIGFMFGTNVLDKDGISAAVHMATMASYLYHHNMTVEDQLNEIYKDYGYHTSNNSYFICHDSAKIRAIFNRIRNFSGSNTYPTGLKNNQYEIKYVRDLTTGYDNSQSDNKAILPVSSSSEMITFTFKNGIVATLRTSGTEPKIKYYTEYCASPSQSNREEVKNTLADVIDALVDELLEPLKNDLIPRPIE